MMLTRRVNEEHPETINIHVCYRNIVALRKFLVSNGVDPCLLDKMHDTITVSVLRIANPTGKENEVMLGFDAPRHIDIVRSEIDGEHRLNR